MTAAPRIEHARAMLADRAAGEKHPRVAALWRRLALCIGSQTYSALALAHALGIVNEVPIDGTPRKARRYFSPNESLAITYPFAVPIVDALGLPPLPPSNHTPSTDERIVREWSDSVDRDRRRADASVRAMLERAIDPKTRMLDESLMSRLDCFEWGEIVRRLNDAPTVLDPIEYEGAAGSAEVHGSNIDAILALLGRSKLELVDVPDPPCSVRVLVAKQPRIKTDTTRVAGFVFENASRIVDVDQATAEQLKSCDRLVVTEVGARVAALEAELATLRSMPPPGEPIPPPADEPRGKSKRAAKDGGEA